ncbi:transglutaminase-like domain-containing protein [Candidatus Woesearchaeota archaeon]|nr:transglutaminase-like domain-containing protein [Candidatus Woesearchaeota archaeon]
MKGVYLFVFLLLIISVNASDDLIYGVEGVRSRLDMSSSINLKSIDQGYSISFASANLSFVPLEKENQQIISVSYNPEPAEKGAEYIIFRWEDPALGEHVYTIEAEILTTINRKKVREKVDFPVKNLSSQFEIYAKATENIDSNDPEIVAIASSLAEGEDDLYVVVNKLVSWIKDNINYSLDTLTAEVSQPASWVIKNRYGVCDEITSLFIAMGRSLGIPIKFISGMAYTNYNNLNDWGPHAWAEVYYPGIGWVAYDITYNEFGYVDASHIVLKESLDSNEASTNYEWRGRSVELEPEKIEVNVELLEKQGKEEEIIRINVLPFKKEAGFGSYDVIEAEVENLQDYYISEDLSIAKVKELEVTGRLDQQIVLKPRETKRIFWLVRISENLDKRYIYTLPITVYSSRNTTGSSSIQSNVRARVYDKEEMQSYIDEKTEEEQKRYSRDISLSCSAEESALLGQILNIDCSIVNEGNVFIEDLDVCLGGDCRTLNLGISKSGQVIYEAEVNETGENDFTVKASNKDVSKTVHVITMVFDKPNIEISGLEYEQKIKFGDELRLKFLLEKTSLSNPLNTEIKIIRGKTKNRWSYGELKESQDFVINFNTKDMAKENKITIEVIYEDDKGDRFTKEKEIMIEVYAERFFDKIRLWLNGIFG